MDNRSKSTTWLHMTTWWVSGLWWPAHTSLWHPYIRYCLHLGSSSKGSRDPRAILTQAVVEIWGGAADGPNRNVVPLA